MRKSTMGEFVHRFGKMIKGIHSYLLKEDELSDTQNMQPGFYWKQRRGQTALTSTAVATGLRFKSLYQYSKLDESEDMIVAHVYDSSNGERIMSGSALPPSAITWTARDTLTASCKLTQFAQVGEALVAANNKEFLIWRGTSHKPTGVFKYINSATAYINYYDEATDGKSDTMVVLDSLGTSDKLLIISEMPLNSIIISMDDASVNSNATTMTLKDYNGSFGAVTGLSDGTSVGTDYIQDDDFSDGSLASCWNWTTSGSSSGSYVEENGVLKITSGGYRFWSDQHQGTYMYQTGIEGDFEVSVKVTNLGNLDDPDELISLMVRDQAATPDQYSQIGIQCYDVSNFRYRRADTIADSTTMTDSASIAYGSMPTSAWFKIKRVTAAISTWYSENGSDWTELAAPSTPWNISTTVDVGVTCGHPNGVQYTVHYDDFTVISCGQANASLAQDGTVSWTASTDEIPTLIEGIPGYAYEFSWDAALGSDVEIEEIRVHSPMAAVKNVWSGQNVVCTGCKVFDGTAYTDHTAYINNDVQSQYADLSAATTSYKFYVGFMQPVSRIVLWVADGYAQENDVSLTAIKYHKNDGTWTSVGSVTDTTETGTPAATLSQNGYWEWASPEVTARYTEKPTTLSGDQIPMFWYEVTFDATLSGTVYVYMVKGVPHLYDPELCYGTFAYKRRAWQLAPLNAENACRYSAWNLPNVWNGNDSGYIYFGERPLRRALPFYNEMVVWADREMWMLQGNSPTNFGKLRLSSQVGIAAPMSAVSIDVGTQVGDKRKFILLWMYYDGFYLFDGVRWLKVSSPDIDNFFDPEHADYINSTYIDQCYGEFDYETGCYLCTVYTGSSTTPNKLIVLHIGTMSYGIYDYESEVSSLLNVKNGRDYLVGGANSTGKFYLLNSGSTDLDGSNAEVAVDAWLTTRDMHYSYSDGVKQRLFSLQAEQADGGIVEVDEYPDGSDTPQKAGKGFLREIGKSAKGHQFRLKLWPGQKSSKFRIRNRSKGHRMNPFGHSTTFDKGRVED